jgi:hypothetical protein
MVFDAHDRVFAFFKGTCRRGIDDNMKTAVETVFVGKDRLYNPLPADVQPLSHRSGRLHAAIRLERTLRLAAQAATAGERDAAELTDEQWQEFVKQENTRRREQTKMRKRNAKMFASNLPRPGVIIMNGSVKIGYFAQHTMDLLDGERTVFQSLEDAFPQAEQGSLRALAGCFGFSGNEVDNKCRVLSGGETVRLVIAKMLYDPPNFLVLDEPTNHLDMATKEMLITALAQ